MLSYLRKSGRVEETLVVVANFANVKQKFRVGVPYEGKYKEILNTDAKIYGGSGTVNREICNTVETEWDGKPYAIDMVSAPLSISIFSYTPYTAEEKAENDRIRAEQLRRAQEEEERRAAEEEKADTARAAAEARQLAKAAAAEAKERARIADEMLKKAQEAEERLQKITLAQKKRAAEQGSAQRPAAGKRAKTGRTAKTAGKKADGK